jgi:CRP/FNR family transcriptional regulator, anaerobic regulatory protein
MQMESILTYLQAFHPLPGELLEQLAGALKLRTLGRKELLLKACHICRHIYFIQRGLFRCYYLEDQSEACAWFMREGDVMVSVESFFFQQESREWIQALEESELYYIGYPTLHALCRSFPEFNFVGRVVTEKYYALSEQRP